MKTRALLTTLFLSALLLTACGDDGNRGVATADNPLGGSPIVARYENGLIAVDRELLTNDVITIPLSFFTEEMHFLQLDDADEALVAPTGVTISDNYILVHGHRETHTPFKLFERVTGRFITNIGAFGQGPNEYLMIYHHQLDEANNRIYILQWQARQILVFDLQGNGLRPIPLAAGVPKGRIHVDTPNETVTVATLRFGDAPFLVWQQTFDGEVIQYIPPRDPTVSHDFSSEVISWDNDGHFDFQLLSFPTRADTLFRYDPIANELLPRFTLNFGRREISPHSYAQTADFFLGRVSEWEQVDEMSQRTTNHRHFMVDKQTLRGSFFRIENDFWGNTEVPWRSIAWESGNYFARNADPGDLLYELENMLRSDNDFSPEKRTRLTELKNSISENDNNWIMFARMRR